ncbi:uncharacterized protein CCOS01_02983 [Colletotrichum costaricense]|uniref:Secreted protein n=1 Tax=Colletotrichum costaricense TaxID=1209916 RepID=A0AAJ0E4T8_9PEZI|nr:uncharacterized protein CCOS01_02983 [Colletotrichum costaricense]KAK1534231.1 hypothetical protein CCOS01_02983 [Colletotrichum costaricense]
MIRHRPLDLHNLWILLLRLTIPGQLSMKMFRMMAFVRYREDEARVAGRVFILVWRARPGMWLYACPVQSRNTGLKYETSCLFYKKS